MFFDFSLVAFITHRPSWFYLSFLIPNLALGLDYRSGFFSGVLNLGMLFWMQFTLPIWPPSLLTILGNCEAQSSLSLAALLSGCNLNTWQGRAFGAEGYGEIMEALNARVKSVNSLLVDITAPIKVLSRVCFRETNLAFVCKIKQRERLWNRCYQSGPDDGHSRSVTR